MSTSLIRVHPGSGDQRKHQRAAPPVPAQGTDLSLFSQEQLDDIAWLLNTRPRKSLGWKAPAELFLPAGAFDFVQYWSAVSNSVALGV